MVTEKGILGKTAILLNIGEGTPYEGDLGRRVNRCYL